MTIVTRDINTLYKWQSYFIKLWVQQKQMILHLYTFKHKSIIWEKATNLLRNAYKMMGFVRDVTIRNYLLSSANNKLPQAEINMKTVPIKQNIKY